MTAHAFPISVLGRGLAKDTLQMTEQETQRLVALTGRDGASVTLQTMCRSMAIELIVVTSHHDLPFKLHHARPMAVVSELDPRSLASCAALRNIAAYDPDMPVLLVSGDDPSILGAIDVAEQLWGLSRLHKLPEAPGPSDLIGFLFQAGRQTGYGRLLRVE